MWHLDPKSVAAGAVVAAGLVAAVAAAVPSKPEGPVGRFQLATNPGHAFVIDTATGQVWEKFTGGETAGGHSAGDFGMPKVGAAKE